MLFHRDFAMTGHEWEIGLLVISAVVAGFIQTIFRRAEATGKRLGRLEKAADFERGRRAGLREKARKERGQ